jgi:carboxyl-terminal processing protease
VVARGSQTLTLSVTPRLESPHTALLTAMRESARVIERGNRRLGYVRLWSGTDPAFLELLLKLLEGTFAEVDGLLLDLRDGMGGAWYDYLDPFFASRDDFFSATWIGADGKPIARERPPRSPVLHYDRPLVVLINEGTRSGKEALAFQFQKSGRATLVGTRTEGAFTAGRGFFTEDDAGYLLYLAVGELLLDGHRIEGIGIDPDDVVDWPLTDATGADAQLQRAIEVLEAAL